jgi:hypothetical protein
MQYETKNKKRLIEIKNTHLIRRAMAERSNPRSEESLPSLSPERSPKQLLAFVEKSNESLSPYRDEK